MPRVATASAPLDAESRDWIRSLSGFGADRDDAVARLHALLVRAARFEIDRRAYGQSAVEKDDLANQAADDALVALLGKLSTYRGDSRFTTWAYKFALLEAGVKLRRRVWQGREIPLEADALERPGDTASPAADVEARELLGAVRDAIASELTEHQRRVLVAVTINDVPIDVLADRLGTTRGALYKTLHDARRKLRAHLGAAGFALDSFEGGTR